MGKVIMSGIVPLLSVPVTTKPNFADNTWAQIIKACQANRVPATWAVGNQKSMTIGGTAYVIDIIGKGHDDYADGSGKAPLTFQLHNLNGDKKAMNSLDTNVGGWASCDMRQTFLPAVLAMMPTEVQNGIREVNKLTSAGSQSSTINTTADKLFLLSEIEIFGSVIWSKSGEGTQYAYYKEGNSTAKEFIGRPYEWWERSPTAGFSEAFCMVDIDGSATVASASDSSYMAFGFCF